LKSATKVTVSTLGALMAVAGIEHGIGELLQRNVPPAGIMFQSWPDSDFFRIVGGEPALTIVPNLVVIGILAILFSLSYLLWAILFVQRKHGGPILILLSGLMLLAGGGIFTPITGMILGIIGTRINAPLSWWRAHLSAGSQRVLSRWWASSCVTCLIAWLLLFPGINILAYFFGVNNPSLPVILILFALGSLLLTVVTGFAHDLQHGDGHDLPQTHLPAHTAAA